MTEDELIKLPQYAQDEIAQLREKIERLENKSRPIVEDANHYTPVTKGTYISYLFEDNSKMQHYKLSPNAWLTVAFQDRYDIIDIIIDLEGEKIVVCGPGDSYRSFTTMAVKPIAQDKIEINLRG